MLSRFAPSRYYLPAVPYVCTLAAIAMVQIIRMAHRRGWVAGAVATALCAAIALGLAARSAHVVHDRSTAALSGLDGCQYEFCWPSGHGYRDAARAISGSATPDSAVVYVVDPQRRISLHFDKPLPPGVRSLGVHRPDDAVPAAHAGPLYVIVDDDRDAEPPGRRVRQVLAASHGLEIVAHYPRPRSAAGVYVLRAP